MRIQSYINEFKPFSLVNRLPSRIPLQFGWKFLERIWVSQHEPHTAAGQHIITDFRWLVKIELLPPSGRLNLGITEFWISNLYIPVCCRPSPDVHFRNAILFIKSSFLATLEDTGISDTITTLTISLAVKYYSQDSVGKRRIHFLLMLINCK